MLLCFMVNISSASAATVKTGKNVLAAITSTTLKASTTRVTVSRKTSSAELTAYKKFLTTGSFEDPIIGMGLRMDIKAFAYVDTNGDGKKELYIRAARRGVSQFSVAYFYLVTYKNGKCSLTAFNEQLEGFYKGTNVKYVSRPGEEIYYYKNKLAYQIKNDERTGKTAYYKYTANNFYPGSVTPQEFKSWFGRCVKKNSKRVSLTFKNNTAWNRKIIK